MNRSFGRKRSASAVAAVLLMVLAVLLTQGAQAGVYVGGGTVVYKEQGQQPAADEGVVVCEQATGNGIGGACIPFSPAVNAIKVDDVLRGTQVAFQVCIDINGDGKCVSGPVEPSTPLTELCQQGLDFVFFSHNDKGDFFNPIGTLPQQLPGCQNYQNRGFNGYVVFLCEGVHDERSSAGPGTPHSHPATTGTVGGTNGGTGFGDFCGGIKEQVVKEYVVMG